MKFIKRALKILVIPLTLAGTTALADSYREVSALESSKAPPGLMAAQKSVDKISISMSCTATRISPQNHYLTAFHCISDQLPLNDPTQPDYDTYYNNHYVLGFTLMEVIKSKLSSTILESSTGHGGGKSGPRLFRVIAIGSLKYLSQNSDFSSQHPDLLHHLQSQGYDGYGDTNDFALIQEIDAPANNNYLRLSCLPALKPNADLWNLSFPNFTIMQDGKYIPLENMQFTQGRLLTRMEETAMRPKDSLDRKNMQLLRFDRLSWSDLDAEEGASGSAVLDTQGEIVGVTVLKWVSQNPGGKHGFTPINVIRENFRKQIKPELFRQLFACP